MILLIEKCELNFQVIINQIYRIMRCKNCGWENPDNVQSCTKCHSPLGGQSSAPMGNYSNVGHVQESVNLKSTVREAGAPIMESPSQEHTRVETSGQNPAQYNGICLSDNYLRFASECG